MLRERLHAENPRHRPVERHVVGPVRAEHDTVDAHGVDQEAQRRLGIHDAVVVELPQIGARRLRDVLARLRAHLPAMVHPSDAVARIAAAVAEDELEIGMRVDHTAVDERGERHRAVDQIADRVGQVIAIRPRRHQRLAALVEEDHGAELLGGPPEHPELRRLQRPAVDVVVDLDALEPELRDAPLQLRGRGLDVLHGHGAEAGESLGPRAHHLADLVVGRPRGGGRDLRVELIVVEADVGRHHMHVDAERIHVGQALLGRPLRARREDLPPPADDRDLLTALVLLAAQGVPVAAVLGRPPEALRREMRVDVDAPHEPPVFSATPHQAGPNKPMYTPQACAGSTSIACSPVLRTPRAGGGTPCSAIHLAAASMLRVG